jgi:DNA-binding cell septation regulator SpoVG
MTVTDVRITPGDRRDGAVLAYAEVILDDALAVKEIRLIRDEAGACFLSMPRRAIRDHCPRCARPTDILARFCADCGKPLGERRASLDRNNRPKAFADVAHPIRDELRQAMLAAVKAAWAAWCRADGRDPWPPKMGCSADGHAKAGGA